MCGIYLITNTITKKVYIGQSVNINRRWQEHKSRAFDNNNNCYHKPLYRSMRKHGIEVFTMTVLCECDEEQLNTLEAQYINEYNCLVPNGYNIQTPEDINVSLRKKRYCLKCGNIISTENGHGLCKKCYAESTRKVERPSAEELFALLSENSFVAVAKKFGVTDNAVRKWCANYGLPTRASDYKKQKLIDKKSQKRKVAQIDKYTDEIVQSFESINDAARSLGKNKGNHITEVCSGKIKTAYGYKWKYLD